MSKIYLSAEVVSGLGEDTFWLWFSREFPNSTFDKPSNINLTDKILQYSTLGSSPFPDNTIGLLWELYPEMKKVLGSSQWDSIIQKVMDCARTSKYKTVSSELMLEFYREYGKIDILPIGVNTDLFQPLNRKELRDKYKFPQGKQIGFWCGTNHPMKGYDKLVQWQQFHPNVQFIVVWKQKEESGNCPFARNFTHISQQQLAELMNCSDFFLSTGLLRPFFMVEYEAMACNLPFVFTNYGLQKDFKPSPNPRNDIFERGWDRVTARKIWEQYLQGQML